LWLPDSAQARRLSKPLGFQEVPDGAGGTFVAWVDDREGNADIWLQHFQSEGSPASGWPDGGKAIAFGPASQYHLSLSADGIGGVYLAWEDYRADDSGDIYATRITSDGFVAKGWTPGGEPVSGGPGEQVIPTIAATVDGAFISWQDRQSGVRELYLQRVNGNGEPGNGWPKGGMVLEAAEPPVSSPRLVSASSKTIALWRHEGSKGQDLMALPVTAEPPDPGQQPTILSTGADEIGDCTAVPVGGYKLRLGWSEWRGGIGTLRIQSLDLDSPKLAEWAMGGIALYSGALGRSAPTITPVGDGEAVAWEDFRTGESEIRVEHLLAAGQQDQAWPKDGRRVTATGQNAYAAAMTPDDAGAVLATWNSAPDSTDDQLAGEMRMASLRPRLVSVTSAPGHVHIVWEVRSAAIRVFDSYRRVVGDDWLALEAIAPDPQKRLVIDDRRVEEGTHVEYRLGYRSEGEGAFFAPVAVDVPIAPKVLTLRSVRARGADHLILVSFSLPRGQSPRLDLIDVTGRRVADQRLDGLDPGEHEVQFSLPSHLPAGIYFLRLLQGNVERVSKTVYLR